MNRIKLVSATSAALLAVACQSPIEDRTGRALTPAEESAWRLCAEWSERVGHEGPESDDAFVLTDQDGIGIVWTNDGQAVDAVGCQTDAAGQTLRAGIANGQVSRP